MHAARALATAAPQPIILRTYTLSGYSASVLDLRTMVACLCALVIVLSNITGDTGLASEGGPFGREETGVGVAGGVNPSSFIQYYAVHVSAGFHLWDRADHWFARHGITARWIVEPWVAFVSDRYGPHQTDSFEIGVSPVFAKLILGNADFRPFVEGGEGILYTDLRKQGFGTRIQFSSQVGVGLEYQIRPDVAVTFTTRLRHMSNGGLASSNPGVNTLFGLGGLTFR